MKNLRTLSLFSVASLVTLALASGCAPYDDEQIDDDLETPDEAALGASVTVNFQNGSAPSASYAGTTDATLQESAPSTNSGSSAGILVDMDAPSGTHKANDSILRFDIGSIPTTGTVSSVKLTVNVTNSTGGAGYNVHALNRAWTESQATWSKASSTTSWSAAGARGADRGTAVLGTLLPGALGQYTLTLNAAGIAAVQSWVKTPSKNFGFVIDVIDNMDGLQFDSSEATTVANRPKLTITYAPPGDACATQKAARKALVPGNYKPGASTTGPLPCVALKRIDGDYTISTPNAVVEGIEVYGSVILTAAATNVTIRHSVFHGPPASSGAKTFGLHNYDGGGLTIEDSHIDLTGREEWKRDGIDGGNLTLRRNEIERGVDGVGLMTTYGDAVVEANWIHNGYYTSWPIGTPGAPQSDGHVHSDAIQLQRGGNYTIRGNLLGGDPGAGDAYNNAGMMIAQAVSANAVDHLGTVLIEKNWLQGGAAVINLAYKNGNDLHEITIRNNRFLRSKGYYIYKNPEIKTAISGNVFDDTNQPVTITTH